MQGMRMVTIKSKREIDLMRAAGKLAAECLRDMGKLVRPGVTPLEIDKACHEWTLARNAIPAPLNYKGFPNSICVSVNEMVCHGIPNTRPLKDGDIVNLDVTPILNGYHGDTSATFFVGSVNSEAKRLVDTCYQAMWKGIEAVKPGATVGDIGWAIEQFVRPTGFSIVVDYCGHGIGRNFHEDPMVVHVGRPGRGTVLKEGMTFTIEPMINMGRADTRLAQDGWTVFTADGTLSAQFEHTVLVTSDGVEVLTLLDEKK